MSETRGQLNLATGLHLFAELKKLIDLPDNCTSLIIHLRVNEPVEVECEYFAVEGSGETTTKRFNLVPADD